MPQAICSVTGHLLSAELIPAGKALSRAAAFTFGYKSNSQTVLLARAVQLRDCSGIKEQNLALSCQLYLKYFTCHKTISNDG